MGIGAAAFTAWWVMGANPANGFSVVPGLGSGLPGSATSNPNDRPEASLSNAVRWSDFEGNLADNGVRGLGGGLEYTIAPDFCSRIIPHFIDQPSCFQLTQSVADSFDAWSVGNPNVRFVDVSNRISPELPPPGAPEPWTGYGAEIDLFTMSPQEYARVAGFGAWTQYWYVFADPVATNGEVIPGNTLTSVDVVFSTDVCFHFDPSLEGQGCNHFSSLLMEEVGHALGLDHFNGHEGQKLGNDTNPDSPVAIDCGDPQNALVFAPNSNAESVMNSTFGKPEPVSLGLSQDDLGGRDFLYPLCPAS